ncbi:MAG: hypothetical protein PHD91_02065 [bacterium]|jgi:hypothetical protein|nr:hypothetical protein [bacterium]MDD3806069.1 hypothetical protein [bacterium]MDD4152490.1 hypothetical protein [bacterium]MDD4558744.1 hypothetical protein [bacterium]
MLSVIKGKCMPESRCCMVSNRKKDRFNGLFWYLLDINRGLEETEFPERYKKAAAR